MKRTLSVINTYIKRDNGVEERGADTGLRMGERGMIIIIILVWSNVQSEGANDVRIMFIVSYLA